MKTRIFTALLLIVAASVVIYLGGYVFDAFVILAGTVASYEMVRVFSDTWPRFTRWLIPSGTLLLFVVAIYAYPYFAACCMLALIGLSLLFIWVPSIRVSEVGVIVFLLTVLLFTILCTERAFAVSVWLIPFVAVASYGTDAGAYFIGRFFGKHKLNERISPNKTIEGAVGGFCIGMLLSLPMGWLLLPVYSWPTIVILCCGMCLVGQIGDLCFSAIKRQYHIKDYGNIFPGHGGVIDRLDSFMFNMLFLFAMLAMIG